MKKLLTIAVALLLMSAAAWSQSLESIKTFALLGQMDKAKVEMDKAANNQKVMGKPEAYILKATIYAALSMTDENRNKPSGNALVEEASTAFDKYKTLDPEMKKMAEEQLYQNGPLNIYYNYYNQGLTDYNQKNWEAAIPKLQKATGYSDFLISKSLLNFPLDTNLLILAGFVAERANNTDVAASFYKRLAAAQVTGPDFEGVYQFMVRYYFNRKEMDNFEKIKSTGAKLYPESEFFQLDQLDFAVGLVDDFGGKIKALNEYINADQENYKAHELRWTYLYDTIIGLQEGDPKPAEFTQWEKDMLTSMKKCGQLKPNEVKNHQFLGNYYVIKKEEANDARAKFAQELQQRTKPGTKASPADVAKREQLDKEYMQALDMILDPYIEAAKIYATMSKLDARGKQQYKNIAGYLAEIYESKKKRSAKDPAAAAKWAAEEKKWLDVYDSLK